MATTTARSAIIQVVESYIYGLGSGDFSKVPFAPDVTYESPISPRRTGQEAIDFLTGLFPIMRGSEIKEHIVEGNICASIFDIHTVHGTLHIFDRFRVENGQLKTINPYYDPAPLKDAQTSARKALLKSITRAYFDGIGKKDMSAVPYADDVVLRSPLAPGGLAVPLKGRKAVLDWFASLWPVVGSTRVWEDYFNEDLSVVATRADIEVKSLSGRIRVTDRFKVSPEGKIVLQENHYDPKGSQAEVPSAF